MDCAAQREPGHLHPELRPRARTHGFACAVALGVGAIYLWPAVLDDAFSRMAATYDPLRASMLKSTQQAFDEGFLGRTLPDISGLYDLTLLNEVLREKKARPIP